MPKNNIWSRAETLALLKTIKQCKCLKNINCMTKRNKEAETIEKRMKSKGITSKTAQQILQRWDNLKNEYIQNLRKKTRSGKPPYFKELDALLRTQQFEENSEINLWELDETMTMLNIIIKKDYLKLLESKNKDICKKIEEEMICNGYTSKTDKDIDSRWNSLLKQYFSAKKNDAAAQKKFLYFDKLEQLLGHTIKSDIDSDVEVIEGSEENTKDEDESMPEAVEESPAITKRLTKRNSIKTKNSVIDSSDLEVIETEENIKDEDESMPEAAEESLADTEHSTRGNSIITKNSVIDSDLEVIESEGNITDEDGSLTASVESPTKSSPSKRVKTKNSRIDSDFEVRENEDDITEENEAKAVESPIITQPSTSDDQTTNTRKGDKNRTKYIEKLSETIIKTQEALNRDFFQHQMQIIDYEFNLYNKKEEEFFEICNNQITEMLEHSTKQFLNGMSEMLNNAECTTDANTLKIDEYNDFIVEQNKFI